jgi:hypothetical protein
MIAVLIMAIAVSLTVVTQLFRIAKKSPSEVLRNN